MLLFISLSLLIPVISYHLLKTDHWLFTIKFRSFVFLRFSGCSDLADPISKSLLYAVPLLLVNEGIVFLISIVPQVSILDEQCSVISLTQDHPRYRIPLVIGACAVHQAEFVSNACQQLALICLALEELIKIILLNLLSSPLHSHTTITFLIV
jgi:hypothetical protein